jgi:hypothetical protein
MTITAVAEVYTGITPARPKPAIDPTSAIEFIARRCRDGGGAVPGDPEIRAFKDFPAGFERSREHEPRRDRPSRSGRRRLHTITPRDGSCHVAVDAASLAAEVAITASAEAAARMLLHSAGRRRSSRSAANLGEVCPLRQRNTIVSSRANLMKPAYLPAITRAKGDPGIRSGFAGRIRACSVRARSRHGGLPAAVCAGALELKRVGTSRVVPIEWGPSDVHTNTRPDR